MRVFVSHKRIECRGYIIGNNRVMIEAWLNLNSRASAYPLEGGGGGGPGTIQVGTFDFRPKPPESIPSVIIMFCSRERH